MISKKEVMGNRAAAKVNGDLTYIGRDGEAHYTSTGGNVTKKAVRDATNNPNRGAIRAALIKERTPLDQTKEEKQLISAFYAKARQLRQEFGKDAAHVDHIITLNDGGWHILINLQILPGKENRKKWAKTDWSVVTQENLEAHVKLDVAFSVLLEYKLAAD